MQDKTILQRAHGQLQVAAVSHTKPTVQSKKRVSRGDLKTAVYPQPISSAVAVLQSQPSIAAGKSMGGPGTNKGIPLSKQKYCEYCHTWTVDFRQHAADGKKHAENQKTGIKWFWCNPCASSFLVTDKETHVCVAPPTKVPAHSTD